MLTTQKGRNIDSYIENYVLFDLETTGISWRSDDVIEISALRVRNGQVTECFSSLVDPGRPIPWAASRVNNITDDMVAGEPTMDEILPQFLEFVGEDVLAGHNIARFDLNFLYRDSMVRFGLLPGNDYVDTLLFARQSLPGLPSYALTALAEHYGLTTQGAHRALNDCRVNQQVFERLAREPRREAKRCPRCGQPMVLRKGPFGAFYGCTGYPGCRYTENIK